MVDLERILERFQERKKNTAKAREHLQKILDYLSKEIPDRVTGYFTDSRFSVKAAWWNGSKWSYFSGDCRLGVVDGTACILGDYESVFTMDMIDYIDFGRLIPALNEFVGNLMNIKTWEQEAAKLQKIAQVIEE